MLGLLAIFLILALSTELFIDPARPEEDGSMPLPARGSFNYAWIALVLWLILELPGLWLLHTDVFPSRHPPTWLWGDPDMEQYGLVRNLSLWIGILFIFAPPLITVFWVTRNGKHKQREGVYTLLKLIRVLTFSALSLMLISIAAHLLISQTPFGLLKSLFVMMATLHFGMISLGFLYVWYTLHSIEKTYRRRKAAANLDELV